VRSLVVRIEENTVGKILIDTDENYFFDYDEEWKQKGFAISPHLPFHQELSSQSIRRFLQNLIPEGEGLDDIALFAHISKNNTFALINAIGYDTAGALVFGENVPSDQSIFREITSNELVSRIEKLENQSIAIWDKRVRLSLAGVQAKLPVMMQGETIGLADGKLSSTHILKFQTQRHLHIVINEFFCMKLAKYIGLNVANVELKYFEKHPVLVVERFDRIIRNDYVQRLHIIDGCQMLDLSPNYKYEQNFGSSRDVKDIRQGASFAKLFMSAKVCSVPASAQMEMLKWALFNLLIGNSDAHGKNFSFFVDKKGIMPTPFYDLLCVMVYEYDHNLAMAFGDEFNPNDVLAYQLLEFADSTNINPKLVSKVLSKECESILKALQEDKIDFSYVTEQELKFVEELKALIVKRAKHFKEISREMLNISL